MSVMACGHAWRSMLGHLYSLSCPMLNCIQWIRLRAVDIDRHVLIGIIPLGVPEVDARHQSAYSLVHVHTAAGSRPAETRRILGRREYEFLKELFSEPLDQSTR